MCRSVPAGLFLAGLVALAYACGDSGGPDPGDGLPDVLAITFTRQDVGEPITAQETAAFTRKLTGFWKDVGYFEWLLRVSHGVHASTGKPDYMVWWDGVQVFREGETVRFYHHDPDGGGHNIMIPTPRVLSSALAGSLLARDPASAKVAEQYCKGITATMLGMVYDENDPVDWLLARNVAAFNHTYTTDEGGEKSVDYSGWYAPYQHWNTGRFNYPDNPTWGSVWVTNMRSKDDVPHIFLSVPEIRYAASRSQVPAVRQACADTLAHLQAAAKDIVDTGYRIRTKDENGEVFIPGYTGDPERDNAAGDLASFVMWDEIIPGGECNAKRASALIGTGTGQGLDCGEGGVNDYERMATTTHYYNYDIVRFFHVAHLAHALVNQDDTAAAALLRGMDARLTEGLDTLDADLPKSRSEWERDLALVALRAAAWGLPLTSREARLIQEHWGRAVDEVAGWAYWDPWAAELPDGELPLRPPDGKEEGGVQIRWASPEDLALLLEYCWSPLKNPAGVAPIDCEIVADPARWGA